MNCPNKLDRFRSNLGWKTAPKLGKFTREKGKGKEGKRNYQMEVHYAHTMNKFLCLWITAWYGITVSANIYCLGTLNDIVSTAMNIKLKYMATSPGSWLLSLLAVMRLFVFLSLIWKFYPLPRARAFFAERQKWKATRVSCFLPFFFSPLLRFDTNLAWGSQRETAGKAGIMELDLFSSNCGDTERVQWYTYILLHGGTVCIRWPRGLIN